MKIIKYILLSAVCFVLVKITTDRIFDNRPFRFEKYRSLEELEEAVKLNFPLGSDAREVEQKLKESGAECYTFKPNPENIKKYDMVIDCDYNTPFLSLYPLEWYGIGLGIDKDHKIVKLGANRVSGLTLVIP